MREDMDNIVAASDWKGYWEILINENTALRARVARLEGVLRFILDECDWEESMQHACGDNRIGTAARRALEEK